MSDNKKREAFEAFLETVPHPIPEMGYEDEARDLALLAWQARAALSTEAQPEVTGAVAEIVEVQVDHDDYSLEVKLLQSLPHGTKLYPPSAIEAAVNAKSEALKERDRLGYAVVQLVEAVDALLEAGSDEYLHDENGDFTYEEAPSDYWADLRTAADNMVLRAEDFEEKYRAIAAPQPSAIQAAVRQRLEAAAALVIRQLGVEHGEILADDIRALMESPHTTAAPTCSPEEAAELAEKMGVSRYRNFGEDGMVFYAKPEQIAAIINADRSNR